MVVVSNKPGSTILAPVRRSGRIRDSLPCDQLRSHRS
jgi:hypothetical protein